ncbi:MAG: histidine kinase [Muribaculum sp.]|nr:histidine kinase [Muribaculum sp.]
MKLITTIMSSFSILTALAIMVCCGHRETVSETEEVALYQLVGEPCSEGDYATAIRRADSLLNAPRQMSDTLKSYIMIDRDVSILEGGNPAWATAYADTVIEFGKKHDIGLAVMQGLQNKGIICRRGGNYDEAISLYKEGLEIAVEENDDEMQQVFSEMLAIACAEHGLNEEAYSFGKKSLELSREMGDSIQELNSAATLSAILAKQGEYGKAIEELRPYKEMGKRARSVIRIKYLTPLLKSYLELDSVARAKETLQEMYDALEGMPPNTQPYYVAINSEAILAEKEGRYQDEWDWLQKADSIGTMGTAQDDIYQQRAKCLANMGRYREAYDYQTKALMALDSLRTSDNDRRLTDLMVKYDSLEKENAISHLKAQRLGWSLVAILCAVALTGLILFAIQYHRKKERQIEKTRHEEYLRGLEQERQRIAKELHDDVAGSILGLQLRLHTSATEDIEDSLISLSRRVRTMSHEMMPPEFSKRTFMEMLHDMIIRNSKSSSGRKITLQEEGMFDWDSLSAEESYELYRVVQQSLSNAMSHGGDGEIRINLSGDDKWQLEIRSMLSEGANNSEESNGIGLRSLRERAEKIDAAISTSRRDGNFIVSLKKR